MSTDLRNVMERISAEYYQLTTSERKVADYITDHQPGTQIMSISDRGHHHPVLPQAGV